MTNKTGYVYLMMNSTNSVLYTGVTSNLKNRVDQHKERSIKGFTERYHVTKLVYFETFEYVRDAIVREKQIKAGSRAKKIELIKTLNPELRDLYEEII
ncbi:MAG: GIY-YIG nuclease family protein [Candidatus Margulisiibacteriota bacterium]